MNDHLPPVSSQTIEDISIQYLAYEGDSHSTIVLLHATGFLPWLWHPIASRLAPEYRVIAPYFCDHRQTDPYKGGLDWMVLARDLANLLSALAIERPVLIGHSMGATVVTLAQSRYGLDAAGLILIEPIFFPEDYYRQAITPEDHPLAAKSLKRRNRWADAAEMKTYLRTKPLFARWEKAFLDLYIEHGTKTNDDFGLELACSPPNEAAIYMGGMSNDPWPLIPHIQCPVLVIEGAESENRQFIDLPAAATRFPDCRYQRVPGAGHLVPMEKSAKILQIIREFSGTLAGG
ncbi:Alpha/beta hydrolase fold [Desulfosarcina cetonica]|uniref:alpha/beta fold hydrolase n=1 Tax=Desulfosarcina cetonica TaxID=90730 RepID=UPI0006D10891|nr:alpha/beta hydrolase [Desulfosarcina cetonica]VTR65891.1 Alpha/beta hydrolase fold [Desulfosarcina cetonica]